MEALHRAISAAHPRTGKQSYLGPVSRSVELATSDDDRKAEVAPRSFVLFLSKDVFKVRVDVRVTEQVELAQSGGVSAPVSVKKIRCTYFGESAAQ